MAATTAMPSRQLFWTIVIMFMLGVVAALAVARPYMCARPIKTVKNVSYCVPPSESPRSTVHH